MDKQVSISLTSAEAIRAAYLPRNPHQMRGLLPETKQAVREFIAAIELARAARNGDHA